MDGDGIITWADADLTEKGRLQAQALGQVWSQLINEQRIPFPSLYTSPLRRCLDTNRIAFEDLAKSQGKPFRPIVKEFLRERLGRHTCNRRSTKSWIQKHYPSSRIEPGFSEPDALFDPDELETTVELRRRQQALLEDLFATETESFVSLTMHTLAAQQLMLAMGHELVRLAPAATMAFLVKAEKVSGSKGLL
jgi:broad specificity phosphatase PhoE